MNKMIDKIIDSYDISISKLAKPLMQSQYWRVFSFYSSYLFFLLKSLDLTQMTEGSSYSLLTQTLLKSLENNNSKKILIDSFCKQCDIWLSKINFNNNQIKTLEKLRDSLLPKLMSGEVRVKL